MDLIPIVVFVAALLAAIGLAEPVAERLRVPATVVHAVMGIGLAVGAVTLDASTVTGALDEAAAAILALPIRSSLFLYVFLPILLFQVALMVEVRRMLDDWVPILVLAVLAVVVATLAVGLALYPFAGLSLMACLMIGAIVSTTDPSAVVGIFRATPAPQRLARIVEGESLLNDAAAIALFGVFFAYVAFGIPNPRPQQVLIAFPWALIGGAVTGLAAGRLALAAIARLPAHPLGQVSISVAVPFLLYIAAELLAGVSGVVAVVAAGLTINYLAPGQLSPPSLQKLRETWELLGYWAGGLIFVLAALLIPRLLAQMRPSDLVLIALTAAAALAARAVILWGLFPVLTAARLSPRVEPRYKLAILWGGLRGAVTLALALAVTESFRIPPDIKRVVGIVATGFTLFTLIVQGVSLRPMIRWLGLDRLSPLDEALAAQVVAVALQSVRQTVTETARDLALAREIVRDEAKRFAARVDGAVARAERAEIPVRDRITLGLIALAGRERDLILERFRERTIPASLAARMLTDADRLIEATRAGGRLAYLNTARRAQRAGTWLRLAERLHARFRISRPLSKLTADRFETLVTQSLILRELHGFIDTRIRRIHGKRVADLLHDLLERRIDETAQALDGLRLQFPGYAEQLERRLIRRMILAQEDREYAALVDDGLIGPELRRSLAAELAERRSRVERRPPLDLAVQKADLIAHFPLFAGLDPALRARLARRLRTRYASPGEVLIRRGERPDRVWFLASGAVEVERATQAPLRLGRGEMFGHLTLLRRSPRVGQVTAITHCTLLTLDGPEFLDLLRRSADLRQAVADSAASRGIPIDPAVLGLPRPAGTPDAPAPAARGEAGERAVDGAGPGPAEPSANPSVPRSDAASHPAPGPQA
jgi:CPA1 family monovalent cation:H+ antiporter